MKYSLKCEKCKKPTPVRIDGLCRKCSRLAEKQKIKNEPSN